MVLLDPQSDDSFLAWGFFPEILQRTEYIEGYVIAPLAERMLEIRPDDFMALQIAAFAARERADRTETYRYAQKLAGLDLAAIEKNEGRALRLFKWLSWIPLFRKAYRNHTSQQAQQKASRAQWVRWAREYVSAVNTRPAAND